MMNKNVTPVIGMGATVSFWSDRHAGTIIDITASGKTITVQADTAIRTDSNGQSESQTYTYERNSEGEVWTARQNKHGHWVCKGGHPSVSLDTRREYYDPSF